MSLDFEKPIIELEEKLNQMKDIAARNGKSLDDEAVLLEGKIIELKKEILLFVLLLFYMKHLQI